MLGKGTQALKRRFPGEKLSILGPLGNGFSFEDNGRKKIIIAGGMGIAPFPFLIKEMISYAKIKPGDIVLVCGVRDKKFLINMNELRRSGISMYISTDNGSKGFKGRASQLLLKLIKKYKIKGDYFACGPQEMLEEITKVIGIDGQRVQVSLEERMACGVGACLSCVKKINGQYLRVCREGPVFWGDEVEWERKLI